MTELYHSSPPEKKKRHLRWLAHLALLSLLLPISGGQESPAESQSLDFTGPVRGVSTMKLLKDRICDPLSQADIDLVITRIKELGASHVALESPYDNPECGDAVAQTAQWIESARAADLNIIHRHMFLAFEGIYDTPKENTLNYAQMIEDYILAHPEFFAPGDVFTPMPEPDNSGIQGFNCGENCFFANPDEFNVFLRDIYQASVNALTKIGFGNEKVRMSCCGMSGFTIAGLNNPDWPDGIIDEETAALFNRTFGIDHYPQGGATMEEDLAELHSIHPDWIIDISEWGAIDTDHPERLIPIVFTSFDKPWIRFITYWHIGPVAAGEGALSDDFAPTPTFYALQKFFLPR